MLAFESVHVTMVGAYPNPILRFQGLIIIVYFLALQYRPFNVITLGQPKSDKINQV